MSFVLVVVMLQSVIAVHGFPSMAACEAAIPSARRAVVAAGGPAIGAVACLAFVPTLGPEQGT